MAESTDNNDLIKEGDQVILKRNNILKVVQIRKGRYIYMERQKFCTDEAIGHFYGTTFEAFRGELKKINKSDLNADINLDQEAGDDNRSLVDLDSNQALSRDDIQNMKKSMSGGAIVDQLVEHSATFQKKTEFAQQKYIKKKKKKYLPVFTALRPTSRLLAQMYYNRGPRKICNMREDALAQILVHANVRAGIKLMVVESCLGLLLGSVMERMAGHGTLIQLYSGSAPVRPALEAFNFPNQFYETLNVFPLCKVATLGTKTNLISSQEQVPMITEDDDSQNGSTQKDDHPEKSDNSECLTENMTVNLDSEAIDTQTEGENTANMISENANVPDNSEEPKSTEPQHAENSDEVTQSKDVDLQAQRRKKKFIREQQMLAAKQIIEEKNMDGLICATRFHPTPVVMALVDYVAPSRPVVVFSQYKEPLIDCYMKLRDKGGLVCLKLTETWLREYQILSNRTHPTVNMSGCGGYLLTGMKIR